MSQLIVPWSWDHAPGTLSMTQDLISFQSYSAMLCIVMPNIRNVDLNLLVVFDALFDERSVTRAARLPSARRHCAADRGIAAAWRPRSRSSVSPREATALTELLTRGEIDLCGLSIWQARALGRPPS